MEIKKIPTPPPRPIPQKPNIQRTIPQQPQSLEVKDSDNKNSQKLKEEVKPNEKNNVSSGDNLLNGDSKNIQKKSEDSKNEEGKIPPQSQKNKEQSKEVMYGLLGGISLVVAIVCFVLMFVL